MKKQKKKYSRPRKPFDKLRIDEENAIRERFGLKNKKEIWKADAAIRRIRNLAKGLITKSEDEQAVFIKRLQKKGFPVETLEDVLALNKEDWLKRRLQTIVFQKKLAHTPRQARQLITHKHVHIGKQIVNIPSYHVSLDEETDISSDVVVKQKEVKESKVEEIKREILDKKTDLAFKEEAKKSPKEEAVDEKPTEIGPVKTEPEPAKIMEVAA